MTFPKVLLALTGVLFVALSQEKVNPNAAVIQDFQKRVAEYMKMHKAIESKLSPMKTTESQAVISERQHDLANLIRNARADAKQGDIFTPEITTEFRRLVGLTLQGQRAKRVKESLNSAEPVKLALKVNDEYPPKAPLQSMPPTLLLNLPVLPSELDYRVVDHALVLRCAKANLVVDFIPAIIP